MNSVSLPAPKTLFAALAALFVFRFWLAAALPMTGDEAYFVLWGLHPAGGYYDHPPMVGWWLTALLKLSYAEWVLRLPGILLPLVLAWGAWKLARPYGESRAMTAAVLVLLQPTNVWNVLMTTDTPLVIFSMLSVVAYVTALRKSSLTWYAAAGALLGMAFLSKYFGALLGIAFAAHAIFASRDPRRWSGLAVLVLAALPAPIYNLYWNSTHSWVNILFNFFNRHDNARVSWLTPVLYAVSLAYLATPFLLIAAWKNRSALRHSMSNALESRAAIWLAGVPLLLLGLMSIAKTVGLHWLLSFVPLLAVPLAIAAPADALARLIRWMAGFAVLHIVIIVVVALLPMRTWQSLKQYDGIVLTVKSQELLDKLAPYANDHVFAMEGYSPAATLAYNARRPFIVFGEGSFHARQDDFLTDWRALDGKNILILRRSAPDLTHYQAYFADVSSREIEVHGVRFHLVLGKGFRYLPYRDTVLRKIRDQYYRIPGWLPTHDGRPPLDRYFDGPPQ